jgi:hypothetical protein
VQTRRSHICILTARKPGIAVSAHPSSKLSAGRGLFYRDLPLAILRILGSAFGQVRHLIPGRLPALKVTLTFGMPINTGPPDGFVGLDYFTIMQDN